ncbi:hypothetical protein B0H19DRAFT_1108747 [Mycena capillaripes]|nr:hypothetical protein B0H19DRAFT_1108747 [Mycena capillaripes]
MASISFVNENIVVIPKITKNPHKNPLLNEKIKEVTPPPSLKSISSVGSEHSATTKYRVLFRDQRCLLTGFVSADIQPCHLVNTIRTKKKTSRINLKAQVEFILTRQGFNGRGVFLLDTLADCIGLDVHWHGELDKRGYFCFSLPLKQLEDLIRILLESNREWRLRAEYDRIAPRNLANVRRDIKKSGQNDPFVVDTLVPLILRPEVFLPDNQSILINTARTLRFPGEDIPPKTDPSLLVNFSCSPDHPFLTDHSGAPMTELSFRTTRTADDELSVFALIVNANAKLEDWTVPVRVNEIPVESVLVEDVSDEDLSVEEDTADGIPAPTVKDIILDHKVKMAELISLIFFIPSVLQNPGPHPGRAGGVSDKAPEPHEFESNSDSDSSSDSDSEYGSPDIDEVLGRVSDPSLSPEARDEAAMLMISLAGGRRPGRRDSR